jgi:hypothetical protein
MRQAEVQQLQDRNSQWRFPGVIQRERLAGTLDLHHPQSKSVCYEQNFVDFSYGEARERS